MNSLSHRVKEFRELAKPRIVSMVLVTTVIGYVLGGGWPPNPFLLGLTLLGTALAAGGAAALNNYLERDLDARMVRTRDRALPSGRIEPAHALSFGVLCVLLGVALLVWRINLISGFLVLLSAFLYVIVYTPLKRVTWLNTTIGAVPGAIPPLSGWTAATGEIGWGGVLLFLILFAWQHPHFYSIAWMYRDDYRRAGFRMLSCRPDNGRMLFRQTFLFTAILIGVSVALVAIGLTGWIYLAGALGLGALVIAAGLRFARSRSDTAARMLLRATLVYLPVLLILIVVDGRF